MITAYDAHRYKQACLDITYAARLLRRAKKFGFDNVGARRLFAESMAICRAWHAA